MFDAHLFICTNLKPEGKPSCARKGAEALRSRVKEAAAELAKEHPERKVRVNASGCLGQCAQGIAAVCYPRGEWLTQLSDDVESEQSLLALMK